jgi:hypothetical protein
MVQNMGSKFIYRHFSNLLTEHVYVFQLYNIRLTIFLPTKDNDAVVFKRESPDRRNQPCEVFLCSRVLVSYLVAKQVTVIAMTRMDSGKPTWEEMRPPMVELGCGRR